MFVSCCCPVDTFPWCWKDIPARADVTVPAPGWFLIGPDCFKPEEDGGLSPERLTLIAHRISNMISTALIHDQKGLMSKARRPIHEQPAERFVFWQEAIFVWNWAKGWCCHCDEPMEFHSRGKCGSYKERTETDSMKARELVWSLQLRDTDLFHTPSNIQGAAHHKCQPLFNSNQLRGRDPWREVVSNVAQLHIAGRPEAFGGPPAHFAEAGVSECDEEMPILKPSVSRDEARKRVTRWLYDHGHRHDAECPLAGTTWNRGRRCWEGGAAVTGSKYRRNCVPACTFYQRMSELMQSAPESTQPKRKRQVIEDSTASELDSLVDDEMVASPDEVEDSSQWPPPKRWADRAARAARRTTPLDDEMVASPDEVEDSSQWPPPKRWADRAARAARRTTPLDDLDPIEEYEHSPLHQHPHRLPARPPPPHPPTCRQRSEQDLYDPIEEYEHSSLCQHPHRLPAHDAHNGHRLGGGRPQPTHRTAGPTSSALASMCERQAAQAAAAEALAAEAMDVQRKRHAMFTRSREAVP